MMRAAPPVLPAVARRSFQLAPLARRYASLGYETLLLSAIVLVVGFLCVPLVSPVGGDGRALSLPPFHGRVLSAGAVFGAAGAYFVWSWTGTRRTLPMKTWRISLLRADGRPVDARTAVARYLATWIGPMASLVGYAALESSGLGAQAAWLVAFNFLWALIDPERQFLHDRIVGTRIVMSR